MSLVSEDGARAVLLNNNRMDPNMPSVPLSHDELALAFEAERIYGVRYENVECSEDPGRGSANVICTYSMDSKLRQLAGLPPAEYAFRLGIREGRIDRLSFPWLNVSFFPGGYVSELEPFVRWLEAKHPEAGGPLDDGELFRTAGQELILILTPESIDLLAGYLEEYERSVNG